MEIRQLSMMFRNGCSNGSILVTGGELINSGIDEKLEEERIKKLRLHLLPDNLQRAFGGNGWPVRPVMSGERVVHIRDGHYLGLQGNSFGLDVVRITAAVQSLMVSTHDFGNSPQLLGPGNLAQKPEAMLDVGLDFFAFLFIQTAFGSGEDAQLISRE